MVGMRTNFYMSNACAVNEVRCLAFYEGVIGGEFAIDYVAFMKDEFLPFMSIILWGTGAGKIQCFHNFANSRT